MIINNKHNSHNNINNNNRNNHNNSNIFTYGYNHEDNHIDNTNKNHVVPSPAPALSYRSRRCCVVPGSARQGAAPRRAERRPPAAGGCLGPTDPHRNKGGGGRGSCFLGVFFGVCFCGCIFGGRPICVAVFQWLCWSVLGFPSKMGFGLAFRVSIEATKTGYPPNKSHWSILVYPKIMRIVSEEIHALSRKRLIKPTWGGAIYCHSGRGKIQKRMC